MMIIVRSLFLHVNYIKYVFFSRSAATQSRQCENTSRQIVWKKCEKSLTSALSFARGAHIFLSLLLGLALRTAS